MTKNRIELSPEFKKQTSKAVASIVLFALTYLLLFILAVGLTAICIYGGIMLIVTVPRIITIALGIGLASFGILILIFLLKFLFKSHKVDRSHLVEIKKSDEPELFKMIDDIVKEVETSFPKKVYLSSDVNAAVFYDSNFWSMFLPIKKNLQIGVGLVNSVSKSELKAILSHEFGHFSQRTMKVGSYVYNVNQVIYNMIYENESYDKLIQGWASISGYFSIFVVLVIKIIEGVQWVLRKLYDIVNINYMGLSREMEFHADEIAANVTGYEPLKTSLLRLNLADHCFNNVLSFYEGKISENIKSGNLYKEHGFVMNFIAKESDLTIDNGLPEVSIQELNRFNKSKLVIKDQWASHPSIEERVERLEKSNITSEQIDYLPASSIFSNIEKTQKKLTERTFKDVQYLESPVSISLDIFEEQYKKEYQSNIFPKVYNGYYDNKNPIHFDINTSNLYTESTEIQSLFSDVNVELVYNELALQNDIETIKQISEKVIPIRTFDYDGKKYTRKEIKNLLSQIKLELSQINEQVKVNDIKIFNFFLNLEDLKGEDSKLEVMYNDFFDFDRIFEIKYELYAQLSNELQFINYTTPFEQIRANFSKINPLETKLKNEISELLKEDLYQVEITKEVKDNFELYLSKDWKYFGSEKYFDKNLEILFSSMNNYAFLLSRGYFLIKKALLDYQIELMEEPHTTTDMK